VSGLFIGVEVAPAAAADPVVAAALAEVCPVDVYGRAEDGTLRIAEKNVDECTLCRLCIDAAPAGAVTVRRLYDGGAPI
jgi:NAD-dependent dihydropyrimidine dehydrogenase PreA subunit